MYLEVTNTVVENKNDNEYVRVSFRPVKDWLPNGKALFIGNSCDRIYNVGKEPKAGDIFLGKIEQYETTPYTIENPDGSANEVRKMTIVVLESEKGVLLANAQLAKRNACVVINGQPTVDFTAKPTPASTPEKKEDEQFTPAPEKAAEGAKNK